LWYQMERHSFIASSPKFISELKPDIF